jgi:hypothetical protein
LRVALRTNESIHTTNVHSFPVDPVAGVAGNMGLGDCDAGFDEPVSPPVDVAGGSAVDPLFRTGVEEPEAEEVLVGFGVAGETCAIFANCSKSLRANCTLAVERSSWSLSNVSAALASFVELAMRAAGCGGVGVGPGTGFTVGGGAEGGGAGIIGNGAASIFAQAAVVAAELIMPAPCWRLTAEYMTIPNVSTRTASSIPCACEGESPVTNVAPDITASTT